MVSMTRSPDGILQQVRIYFKFHFRSFIISEKPSCQAPLKKSLLSFIVSSGSDFVKKKEG